MRLVTFKCDGCGATHTEEQYGAGAPGWFGFKSVLLDGAQEPTFCPDCKGRILQFVDEMRRDNGLGT